VGKGAKIVWASSVIFTTMLKEKNRPIWSPCCHLRVGLFPFPDFISASCDRLLCAAEDSVNGQCCQMVYFQTKNYNLGKFWKACQWKMSVFLRLNGIFYGHLVHFVVIWYIFLRFGTLYREKSGNPVNGAF
jgi:hypothetical protein